MKKYLPLIALLTLACGSSTDTDPASTPNETPAETPAALADGVYRVECGCILDAANHECGNWIEVDGTFHEIAGVDSLGVMEWCHDEGNTAKAEGSVLDGKFVATAFEVLPK